MRGIHFNNCHTDFSDSYSGGFEPGVISGMSGASGSGKSTLLKCIADLLPHKGDISFGELQQNQTEPREWRKNVRYIHEHTFWWKPVVSDHFKKVDIKDLVSLGLDKSALSMECAKLSTGENKRLGLLRGLQDLPKAILLDEPTSNLDSSTRSLVIHFIQNYYEKNRPTIVIVSHDVEMLEEISNGGVFDVFNFKVEESNK